MDDSSSTHLPTHLVEAEEDAGFPLVVAEVGRDAELAQGGAVEPAELALGGHHAIAAVHVAFRLIGWVQGCGEGDAANLTNQNGTLVSLAFVLDSLEQIQPIRLSLAVRLSRFE